MKKPWSNRRGWTDIVIGAVMLVLALLLVRTAVVTVDEIVLLHASDRWRAVEGSVVRAGTASCGKGNVRPDVSYAYPAVQDGRSVQRIGHRLVFGAWPCGGRQDLQSLLLSLPVGTRVTVYVDPDDPREAVLWRRMPVESWIGLGVCVVATPLLLWLARQALFGKYRF